MVVKRSKILYLTVVNRKQEPEIELDGLFCHSSGQLISKTEQDVTITERLK